MLESNAVFVARSQMNDFEPYIRRQGLAVVLSGPSGVGKDTVLDKFLPQNSSCLRLITATTRPKRDMEIDGVDYSFLSQEEFDTLRDTNQLLEHADVYGYSYGSPRKFVDEKRAEGFDVILKLDVQGGLSVKEAMPDAVMVFLAPPSMEELERRLRGRRTESPEQFAKRLGNALAEIKLIPHYDYLIVHNTPEQACEELGAIIQAERLKVAKNG